MNRDVNVRRNIQVEPLFNYRHAWPYLVPRMRAPRYLTQRQVKIRGLYLHAYAPQVDTRCRGPTVSLKQSMWVAVAIPFDPRKSE
jgi:hypothetical protein